MTEPTGASPDKRAARTPSPGDLLRRRRARLLARAGVRHWLARLPLLSRVASRKSRSLFDLTAGFLYSQVLFAGVELGLFERLLKEPLSTAGIADAFGLEQRPAELLVRAAEELDLIVCGRDGRWSPSDLGAVVAGDAGIAAMIRHHAMLYRDLADPLALLRGRAGTTEMSAFWSYAGGGSAVSDDQAESYSELMALSQDLIAAQVLAAYPLSKHRTVLDVGGGSGAFLDAVGRRHPKLQLRLFDLPAVAPLAEARFAETALAGRFAAHGGSFFDDRLPADADLVTLVRVLCDQDDSDALRLLRNVCRSMDADATLLIAEPMAGDGGAGPAAAYFSFYFLAMKAGRCRSPAEIVKLLEKTGFNRIQKLRTRQPLLASVIVAHPCQ